MFYKAFICRYIVLIFIIMFVILFSGSCGKDIENQIQNTIENNTSITESSDNKLEMSEGDSNISVNNSDSKGENIYGPLILTLEQMIVNGSNSTEVADYVNRNIGRATPSEADRMIDLLIAMQSGLIQYSHNGKLYESEYLDALNTAMGGILDADKVGNIEDETIRNYYRMLIDSDLTIVRYEETPVVETDWIKIKSLEARFTAPLQMAVDYSDYRKLLRLDNIDALVNRIYDMEALLPNTEEGFSKDTLMKLYDTYVGNLLTGVEGSALYRLTDASDLYYQMMSDAIYNHDNSGFAQTAAELMASESQEFMDLINIVDAYRSDNPYNSRHWVKEVMTTESQTITRLIYKGENEVVTETVNAIISSAENQLVEEAGGNVIRWLSMYRLYNMGDPVTINLYISYTDQNDNTFSNEKFVSIDLSNGKELTLGDLLEVDEVYLLDKINTLTGHTYTMIPDFQMIDTGILLIAQKDDSVENQSVIVTNDVLLKNKLSNIYN